MGNSNASCTYDKDGYPICTRKDGKPWESAVNKGELGGVCYDDLSMGMPSVVCDIATVGTDGVVTTRRYKEAA